MDDAAQKRREHYQKTHPVTDYHDMVHPGTPKEVLIKLFIGAMYINGAICKLCNSFIRSRNKHDMVTCRCGAISVDGGSHYAKRSGQLDQIEEVIVPFDCYKEPK